MEVNFCSNYNKNIQVPGFVNDRYKASRARRTTTLNITKEGNIVKSRKRKNKSKINKFNTTCTLALLAIMSALRQQPAQGGTDTFILQPKETIAPFEVQEEIAQEPIHITINQSTPDDIVLVEPLEIQEDIIEQMPTEAETNDAFDFEINLCENQELEMTKFLEVWNENKERYYEVANKTNIPAELICAIHFRESGGDFNTCLHNGAKLATKINTPNGKKIFYSWEDSAVDALLNCNQAAQKVEEGNIQSYFDFAENYNGTGYRYYHNINSPYVWAGTDKYTSGKYTSDGKYNPNVIDKQLGVAVMLKLLLS